METNSTPHQSTLFSRLFGVLMGLALVTAVAGALFFLYREWRSSLQIAGIDALVASPNLSQTDRLLLELYLGNNADALQMPIGNGTESRPFTIAPGEPATAIAANLASVGLLRDSELFLNFVAYTGLDAALVAGSYQIDPTLTVPQLATLLSGNGPRNLELSFLPGWRMEEMTAYLDAVRPALIDPQEFLDIATGLRSVDLGEFSFLAGRPPGAPLEGYLYPTRYPITTEMTSEALIRAMLAEFGRQVDPAMRQAIGSQGISLNEAVILASIVEREAIHDEEKPVMASVFLNRFRAGMPLQADPTVQYALGFQEETGSWWKAPLSLDDLAVVSPFNTYQIDGLPPAPIANPSRIALEAVAFPADTPFLFFVLDCTAERPGTHDFSVTFDEHLAKVQRCR